MEASHKLIIAFLFGALIMMLIMIGTSTANSVWHKQAINHQCAEFNSKTGKFQWLNEVK